MKYITTHSKVAGEIGHWSFALGCACYTYWRPYTYTDRYGENDDDDCDDVLLMFGSCYTYWRHYSYSSCYGDDDYDCDDVLLMVMDGPCYTYSSVYRL